MERRFIQIPSSLERTDYSYITIERAFNPLALCLFDLTRLSLRYLSPLTLTLTSTRTQTHVLTLLSQPTRIYILSRARNSPGMED